MARPTKKNPTGAQRSPKKTKDRIEKLEQAAAQGFNILESCAYAMIHPDTYYTWVKKDKELADRLNLLRQHPTLQARMHANLAVRRGDSQMIRFVLERKARDDKGRLEFARHDVNTIQTIDEDGEPAPVADHSIPWHLLDLETLDKIERAVVKNQREKEQDDDQTIGHRKI